MISDSTTFFLSFLAVFGGLAAYLWHLNRLVDGLQQRLDAASTTTKSSREVERS